MNKTDVRSEKVTMDARLHGVALLARALNDVTTPSAAIQAALDALMQLIPADALRLTTSAGEDRQRLSASLDQNGEFRELADGEVLRVSHTMLERAVQTGAPVYFNDAPHELVGGALLIALACPAAQSVLCAPLMLGGKATGTVIISTARVAHYTEGDSEIASLVGALLASTLERLELASRMTFVRTREEARLREDALVQNLYAAARASVELNHIIQHAIDTLAQSLPASFIVLRAVAFGQPEATLRAWTPGDDRPPLEIHAPVSRAERVVYTEQRAVLIEDARGERAEDLRLLVERLGARSFYLLPVIYGGQVLAALGLVESDTQRRWTTEEQLLLARVAETIAPLILNAQLHTRQRACFEDLLTLLRMSLEVESEAELERCLSAVLDSWAKVANTDAAAILRWDEEHKLLRLAAMKHLPTALLERYTQGIPLTDTVCGLAAERRVGVVADLASEARFADLYSAVRWSSLRGVWATPITGPANRLSGILITFSRVAAEVGPDEQRLADLFTRPVALAIEKLEWSRSARLRAQLLEELEENLFQAERHKTEFMSIISHELRTPLNAIIGYAQMLKDGFSGELNEQQRVDVQTIAESADHLLRMVEDTLDLARLDAERFPVYMDVVAFDEVIRRAVEGVRQAAEAKGLDVHFKISDALPVIRTDPERVRQILTSLLSNAVKFTDSGLVQVTVEPADAGSVQINVMDTGIGFDINSYPHIFDEFRQGDASNTRQYEGSGLGLAVAKRLVQKLGGLIGVVSTPGEGSTFWVRLPPEVPGADV
ncbi:MAG TPA: ATP-binding protein [Pyrinomonadaceae bacterium]|jgi:signal transduction histidine kinase